MSSELPSLRTLWEEFSKIEKSGLGRTARAKELESMIHQKQKNMNSSLYDFDARWDKNKEMAKSSVEGPPDFTSVPTEEVIEPQSQFTLEQAKKLIGGDNNFNILEECIKRAEAEVVCGVFIANKINPENQKNPARRGQVINIGSRLYEHKKEPIE